MPPAGAIALLKSLADNSSLKEFTVGGINFGHELTMPLASMLKLNTTLQKLSLHKWELKFDSPGFIEALTKSPNLRHVGFPNCHLGSKGGLAMAAVLRVNPTWQSLILNDNGIGEAAGLAVIAALRGNRTLQNLDLSHNHCSRGALHEITQLLARNQSSRHESPQPAAPPQATRSPSQRTPPATHLRDLRLDQMRACQGDLIGSGTCSTVYKGQLDHSDVAIKVFAAQDTLSVCTQDLEALATLRHPHLVRNIAKCSEAQALLVEYMAGGSVQDALQEDQLPWWDRVRILYEAAVGLQFLHNQERPIFHRDLRPSNILLGRDGKAKLADAALAKGNEGISASLNREAILKGPIQYLCPELLAQGVFSCASDVYSFGIVMAVVVTGLPPHNLMRRVLEASGSLVDPRPGAKTWDPETARQLLVLALECTKDAADKRPPLQEVLGILEGIWQGKATECATQAAHASAEAKIEQLRQEVTCPITLEVMSDPVQAADGFTYERAAIEDHLAIRATSPMTNMRMSTRLTKNRVAASVIRMLGGTAGQP